MTRIVSYISRAERVNCEKITRTFYVDYARTLLLDDYEEFPKVR